MTSQVFRDNPTITGDDGSCAVDDTFEGDDD
jgi:hypothetical protein